MTITSIQKLPSGKTGATITSNLDELAIIRGLVVNALRHMPDVCETTSTRQRLKAMSRALHKGYKEPVLVGSINYGSSSTATLDAEQEGKLKAAIESVSKLKNPPAVFAEYTGKHWSLDKGVETACAAILSGMPPRFTYQEFADRVTSVGLATDNEAREILVSLLNGSKEWVANPIDRVVRRAVIIPITRKSLGIIWIKIPTPFARTKFIDEALDHGYTIDEISKWLNKWLDNNPWYKLDTKTDTVVSISDLKDCSPGIANAKTLDEVRGPNRAERDWMDRQCGAIDPKSIPNPDYVPVSTPAPTPTPKRTLWSIYNDMPNAFASTAFVKKSNNHSVETTKATDFLLALSRLDVIWRREDGLFVKTVTPNSRNITMLIGLIGQ